MSENKYIIDKDSLTGIADAVRDKLGNGKAITDENAGYYPVPIKKLGYHETSGHASFSGPGSGYADSTIYARPISELVNICGIRPSYIKVTASSTGFNTNDIIFRYTNINSPSSSRVASVNFDFANRIAILPIPDDIDDCYIAYGAYYSTYSSQYSKRDVPAYDAVFLDSNQNEIDINGYSEDSFPVDQWGTRETFLTKTSFEKIPYSIDDIQNKITNYLNASGGGGLKIFRCYNKNSSTSSEGDGWKVSNYLTTTAYYDLDFSSTSPYYITTQVPDLNPENIIFIWYAGRNATGSKQSYFIFEPTLKDVEHYTSASISNGKRLSSATDYYFFPDGAGSQSTSNDYGIMGMWDANNKILDLGLQEVSSRSGTYVASDYTT